MRVLVWVDGGRPRALSRNDKDVTGSFPELRAFGEALGSHQALFDGELVVLGADGRPSFARLQHRMHASSPAVVRRVAASDPVSLVIFDLLHLDGASLLGLDYDHRRAALEGLGIGASGLGGDPFVHLRARSSRSSGPPSTWAWRGSWPSGGRAPIRPVSAAATGSR